MKELKTLKEQLTEQKFFTSEPADIYEPKFSPNSLEIMQKRHLMRDIKGNVLENPKQMFWRVASHMAFEDAKYVKGAHARKQRALEKSANEFYNLMAQNRFLPGSRVLFEAGNHIDGTGQLSSCFVLPIEDSLESIFQTMKEAAVVQKNNGGTGFNFSHIRPKGDVVGGTPNVAAGPVHFIKTFSQAFDQILQGKKRGGGNMAILNIDHPDILEFINLKGKDNSIRNFNISVGVTDKFMQAAKKDLEYDLINPSTAKTVKKLRAREVFDLICEKAWECADPGLFYADTVQNANPTKPLGVIEATNPCGEEPLRAYESCNLGSIVLPTHLTKINQKYQVDWDLLAKSVHSAIHFLENMIDLSKFPLEKINREVKLTRKLGLGIVGFGSMLFKMHIPYNSQEAIILMHKITEYVESESIKESQDLAKERGVFPGFKGCIWEQKGLKVRNATMTSIAPTGTLSLVANTSSGIEPIFSLVYKRKSFYQDDGKEDRKVLLYVDENFAGYAKEQGFYSEKLMEKIAENEGSLKGIAEIPETAKKIFVTTHDIDPYWHVAMQAAAQKNVDAAVSKTINLHFEATKEDVKKAYIQAWEEKCKGITIYRDGSKQFQVLETISKSADKAKEIVITSSNLKKISEISEYIQTSTPFKVKSIIDKKFTNEVFKGNLTENTLLEQAVKNARAGAKETGYLTIADETGFLYGNLGISKSLADISYFGKNEDYSEVLFNKLSKYQLIDGKPGFLASAMAIFDPASKKTVKTIAKIPGKFITTNQEKYNLIFIHDSIPQFSSAPNKSMFQKYNHRFHALKQVFNDLLEIPGSQIKLKYELTPNAIQVLEKRALLKDINGNVMETPAELWQRIANHIASCEKKEKQDKVARDFFELMNNNEFFCGGTILWAGMGIETIMSKCLVLPIEDSIDSIFQTLNMNIQCLRRGVGTGFNFSNIRSTFAKVKTTNEHASGPVEYLKMYDRAQDTIRGRGGRGLGSMAILNADHPNIHEFLAVKDDLVSISHYNISVGASDKFIQAVKNNKDWQLIDPKDKKSYATLKARDLFENIAKHAWKSGDPGLFFLDNAEKGNTTPELGKMNATNPCGEQPLIPFETCNMGHINVSQFITGFPFATDPEIKNLSLNKKLELIDWDRMAMVTELGVRFLDNMIDVNVYPIKEIDLMTKKTRNIGVGIMGYADLLIKLGVTYGSEESLKIAEELMKFIQLNAHKASQDLGREKGNFPAFTLSIWYQNKLKYMRNTRVTTIAPTGTISLIADCNPGIEPLFALGYRLKNSMGGTEQEHIDQKFIDIAKTRGFYSEELMHKIADGVQLQDIAAEFKFPADVVEVFKTTHEIDPEKHVKIQAAFQKHTDSAVSKTINLPNKASWQDIARVYMLAYDSGCKGITVFRDGSKDPALQVGTKSKESSTLTIEPLVRNSLEPRKRELVIRGFTYEVKTEQGDLFVTINEDDQGIFEIFLNLGKSGSFTQGYTEALGRLISMALRSGIKAEQIIKQLQGIRTSAPTLNRGMIVYSVPDAVAKIMKKHLAENAKQITLLSESALINASKPEININITVPKVSPAPAKNSSEIAMQAPLSGKKTVSLKSASAKQSEVKTNEYTKLNLHGDLLECPDCGSDLEYAEGCILCRACGFSKCG